MSQGGGRPWETPSSALQSLIELGQSLRAAREELLLTQADAAESADVSILEVEAFEAGEVERLTDRIDTLTSLRRYAHVLRLNGDDYVLAAVEFWPRTRPASWTVDREQRYLVPVPNDDDSITGMVDVVGATTGPVPIVGPLGDEYRSSAPAALKVLVVVVAVLVVLGAGALSERTHVVGWYHRSVSAIGSWFDHSTHTPPKPHRHVVASPLPKVSIVNGPATDSVIMNVSSKSFTVKMAAYKYPCWMEVTKLGQSKPVYEQVMPGGDTQTFTITGSDTVRTASGSARAYVYEGSRFIGFYFPKKAPFLMTFNATG